MFNFEFSGICARSVLVCHVHCEIHHSVILGSALSLQDIQTEVPTCVDSFAFVLLACFLFFI